MNNFSYKSLLKYIAVALTIAIFFIADRSLKSFALANPYFVRSLGAPFLSFIFTPNRFIAFSLPLGGHAALITASLLTIALGGLTILSISKKKKLSIDDLLLFAMFLGSLSNLLDRLTYGFVVDYIYLRYFTVFNLADTLITVSALILIYRYLKKS